MSDNKILFEKSFASHEKAKYWSNNNSINPSNIRLQSHKKYWFNCDKCNHEFEKQISEITLKSGWCSFCANRNLCDDAECKDCYEKSFASHEKSKYWSDKNDFNIKPCNILKYTNKKYIFNCDKCNHEFEKTICNITGYKNGWCPYCVNKTLCDDAECKDCYEKSFASHEKSKYWNDINTTQPRYVFKNTHDNFIFDCKKCNHTFQTSPKIIN